jgi:glc operon protein GlcG
MQEAKSLGLKEARKIVDAIIEAAEKNITDTVEGRPMAAAVVDRHGDLVYFARMDGASPLTAHMSIYKAYTAILVRRDTITQRKLNEEVNLLSYEFCWPTYTTIPGGVLIKTKNDTIVGAVGTSGRHPWAPMGDEELARIGAKAFGDNLE